MLLTGESGSGKTWLCRQLVHDLEASWRSVTVDLSRSLEARDLLQLIAHGLGLDVPDRPAAARIALSLRLHEEKRNGRSWLLIVENLQKASEQVRDELESLLHSSEAHEGFAGFLLTGPTSLIHLLMTRDWAAISSRLQTHVHLLPFDLDEARELADADGSSAGLAPGPLEELHREARGNPRRLVHLLRTRTITASGKGIASPASAGSSRLHGAARAVSIPRSASPATQTPQQEVEAGARTVTPGRTMSPSAPLVPVRPPLRVEEGLIEVGWEGSLEEESTGLLPLNRLPDAEAAEEDHSSSLVESVSSLQTIAPLEVSTEPRPIDEELPSEEMIEDHYAALQAWAEWAKNRGRDVPALPEVATRGDRVASGVPAEPGDEEEAQLPAGLRAEPQHDHAPYSQLFTRLQQSR
jgi:hypothetical protein